MAPATAVGLRTPGRRRHQGAAVRAGDRIGEACRDPVDRRSEVAPSRTASASATRSSSSGCDGSGPACRTSSQPRGAVTRPACTTHRSHECGSATVASDRPPQWSRRRRRSASRRHSADTRACSSDGERSQRKAIVAAPCATPDTRSLPTADLEPLRSCSRAREEHRRGGQAAISALTPGPRHARTVTSPRCRVGAVAPSGSTWRCWRLTSRSSGVGRTD